MISYHDILKAFRGEHTENVHALLWGKKIEKNQIQEISGIPPLTFKSYADYLKDYRIYGNTVQDGTSAPDNPVEVVGCGEYDSENNGYKIPVTNSDGTNSITTPVYIGSEPLHKIGDYADYVDYKRGVVVRRIKKLVIRGDETGLFNLTGGFSACRIMVNVLPNTYCFSSHFFSSSPVFSYYDVLENSISVSGASSNIYANGLFDSIASIREFFSNQYSAGTPVTVWYVLAEPEEEPLENLLPIQTIRGTNVLTADTTVQPSEMYIKGKIKEVNQNE